MSRAIVAAVVLVALSGMSSAASAIPERESHLLLNGGFELVSPANPALPQGWEWGVWPGSKAQGQLDSKVTHSGKASFRLRNPEPVAGTFSWLTQLLPTLEPNTEYVLSFWAKAEDNVGGWVALEIDDAQRKSRREYVLSGTGRKPTGEATFDWKQFTYKFNTGEDIDWTILICADGKVQDLWVDDMTLRKLTPAEAPGEPAAKPGTAHRCGDAVSVRDFGAVGDRVTDDTAAIQAALDSLGAQGGTVLLGNGRYLTGNLIIPENVGLVGDLQSPGMQYDKVKLASRDYSKVGAQLCLKPGCSVLMRQLSSLQNCVVIRAGLPLPAPNDAAAAKLVAAFSGKGVIANESGILIRNCLILGFDTAIYSGGRSGGGDGSRGRIIIDHCRIDSNNGIDVYTGADVIHIDTVHCWPFLTAAVPGVTGKNLHRPGTGIMVRRAEWLQVSNSFCYGYKTDFACEDGSAVSFNHCQADHGGPNEGAVGFAFTGHAELCAMLGCTVISQHTGALVDMSGRKNGFQDNLRIEGCTFANGTAIDVRKGSVVAIGNTFNRGNGIKTGPEADPVIIIGNCFDEVGTPLELDGKGLARSTVLGNNYVRCKSAAGEVFNAPVVYPKYTMAELPGAASAGAGATVFVTDAPGGPGLAVSDGTHWNMLARAGVLPAPKR